MDKLILGIKGGKLEWVGFTAAFKDMWCFMITCIGGLLGMLMPIILIVLICLMMYFMALGVKRALYIYFKNRI